MDRYPIYLVTKLYSSGQTTWMHQKLTTTTEPSAYICLGTEATPIDPSTIKTAKSNQRLLWLKENIDSSCSS